MVVMKEVIKRLSILVFFGVSQSLAQSVTAPLTREMQAEMVMKLWIETCAKHFANPDGLRAAAKSFRFQENPPYAAAVLKGEAGTVWDVSLGAQAQSSVALFENGKCQVLTRRASSNVVLDIFERVIAGIKLQGAVTTKIDDIVTEQANISLRTLSYFIGREKSVSGWGLYASVSDSEAAVTQAVLTIARTLAPEK
jgi:hypothetical protein